MNYENFINKKVINSDNQEGIIISIDDEYITIRYSDTIKTYNKEIAFKNNFLKIVESDLNQVIKDDLENKDNIKSLEKERVDKCNKIAKDRNNRINEIYQKMLKKNYILKQLFGSDFIYHPLKEFEKKYKLSITKFDQTCLSEKYF